MELTQGKKFEKPDAGMFLGTLIDLVEMPNVQTQYGVKNKVRLHWVLAQLNGSLVLDKEGKPMEVVGIYNASVSEKSELTKRVKQILNGPFPLITGADGTEQLAQLLIGRSNVLLLAKVDNPKDPNDPYTNVEGIAPVMPGSTPPAIPTGYIRHKNRPKTQAGPQGQPVQTFAQPPAQAAAPAVAPVGAPTPQQIAAYLASQAANQPNPTATFAASAAPAANKPF